jgi:hypothetical protein
MAPHHQRKHQPLFIRRHIVNSREQTVDMGFAREALPDCHHVCLIYDSAEQRRAIVAQYLAAGLQHGEIVRYFADTTAPDDVRAWLLALEVDPREDGSFGIVPAENAYCPSGNFVPQIVLDNMLARYAMAKEAGYSGSRACGEMTWVLRKIPGADRFPEYEVGINLIHEDFPYVGMCQYDARLFDGATLFRVLQVHPHLVAQGQFVRNPFYIKPEEFLATARAKA